MEARNLFGRLHITSLVVAVGVVLPYRPAFQFDKCLVRIADVSVFDKSEDFAGLSAVPPDKYSQNTYDWPLPLPFSSIPI